VIDLSFTEIIRELDNFELPDVDIVIGIGDGGIVPAALTAQKLNRDLKIIKISHRDEFNIPKNLKPELVKTLDEKIINKRILLVDDVSVTGKTLDKAKEVFAGNTIITFVFKGNAADYTLFKNIKECVAWPWKH
jgi:uncharacterized protein